MENVGLIRVALLLYPPPTRPLGPLPDPYLIPRGYLIPTGQKIKQKSLLWHKNLKKKAKFLVAMRAIKLKVFYIIGLLPIKSHC